MIVTTKEGFKFEAREDTLDEYVVKENPYTHRISLDKEDIWLDIGAHIGTFAVRFASQVGRIISFEPDKTNYALLKKNLRLNRIKNVDAVQSALVGNSDESRKFYLNTKMNTGAHSFLVRRGRQEVNVSCANINEVIALSRANKIKMDIEGAEYELICAIEHWAQIDEIIYEFDFAKLKDKEHKRYFETIRILKRNGFRVQYNKAPGKTWHTIVVGRKT